MTDVSEITGNALETVRKKANPAEQLKNPAGLAGIGAALIALPYAAQGVAKLASSAKNGSSSVKSKVGGQAKEKLQKGAKNVAGQVADEKLKPSMPGGLGKLFGGGDDSDGGDEETSEATGSGRRMPIQQSVDVAVPIDVAYNLWTQFEDWPDFMHRVDSAQQVDDCTVAFTAKVWGITKRFQAQIKEQRPDERIEWEVEDGLKHSGVVTFHRLAPRLTRIEATFDVQPDSLLEKAGRGMRFTKRAARGDLHRFKAHAEMQEEAENGGWRGTIEDGEVKRRAEKRRPSKPKSRSRSSSRNGSGGSRTSKKSRSSGKSRSRS
jgi:uncharacterized membrane protein